MKAVGVIPLGGGMNIGLENAGWEIGDVSFEINEAWTANLRLNRPGVTTHVTSLDEWERWAEGMREKPPELVFGIPPCQGFSGASSTSSLDNPKNQYLVAAVKTALIIKPMYAIFENIPRALSIGAPLVRDLEHAARDEGYTMSVHEHHVAEFGVCQRRQRVMFVLERKGQEIPWPSHERRQAPTVMEQIGDLESVDVTESCETPVTYVDAAQNEWQAALRSEAGGTWDHDAKLLPDRFDAIPPGRAWMDGMPRELMTDKERERIDQGRLYNAFELYRLHPDRVARTLTGARNKMHPTQCRVLSVRENSRLMAYPDDWKWAVPGDVQQFAAGVCPPVAEWYGRAIMHALAGTEMPVPAGRLF